VASDLNLYGGPGGSYDNFGLKSTGVTVTLTGVGANLNRGDLAIKRVIGPFSDLGPGGTPVGKYNFSNIITVEVNGVSGTCSFGDLTVTGDVNYSLTTDQLASGLGTIVAAIPVDVALTGQSGTGANGSLTVTTDAILSVTGTSATGSAGTVVALLDGAVPIDGTEGTAALGTVTLSTQQIITPTSVDGTASTGTITPVTDQVISVTGNAGTSASGSLTVPVIPAQRANVSDLSLSGVPGPTYSFGGAAEPVSVTLTGPGLTGSVATFDASSLTQEPDGNTGTGSAGTSSGETDQVISITSTALTASIGDLILPVTVTLTGVQRTASIGQVSAVAGGSQITGVAGNEATGSTGSVTPSTDQVVSVTGVSGSSSPGTLIINQGAALAAITGVSGAGASGEIVWSIARGAGRRSRRKRQYSVQLDGEYFVFNTIAEVEEFLAMVRKEAEERVDEIVTTVAVPKPPRITVKTRTGKATTSQAIQKAVKRTQKAVIRAYAEAAKRREVDQEISQLLTKKIREEDDEEEAILAILLSM
jgi:hypothetical protein